MTDIAEVGVGFDSSELVAGVKASEDAMDRLAESFKNGATSTDQFGAALDKLSITQKIEVLQRLGLSAEEAAAKVKAGSAAHAEFNTEATATGGLLSGLWNILSGYGTSHKEAAVQVEEHAKKHGILTEATHLFQEAIHAVHPELRAAGVGMGELTGFSMAARAGVAALATALVGTLVVELVKTQSEMQNLKDDFADVFGNAAPEMLEKTEQAAVALGTTMDKLAPSIASAYSELRKGAVNQEMDQKATLQLGNVTFAPGHGGQEAMKAMLNSQSEIVVEASSKTGQEIKRLQQLFQQTGVDASSALGMVANFWSQIPTGAEAARSAAVKATADFTKLFEVAGKGGDDAAAATQKLFSEVQKGGLTSGIFDKLATDSRVAAATIAEGFGFKGPEAIERFSVALERVKGISFNELITGVLSVHDHIEELKPSDSVTRSWGELKTAFRTMFEDIVKGITETDNAVSKDAEGGAAAKFLKGIADGMKAITPPIISGLNAGMKELSATIKDLKASYEWFLSVKESTLQGTAAGIAAGAVAGGVIAGPVGALVGGVAGGAIGADIGSGNAFGRLTAGGGLGGTEGISMGPDFGGGGTPSSGAFPAVPANIGATALIGATTDTATESVNKLDTSLGNVGTSSDKASTSTDTFSTSISLYEAITGTATQNSKQLAEGLQLADEQLAATAQSAPNAVNAAQSSLQSFFNWLSASAQAVAANASGGGGGGSSGGGGGSDSSGGGGGGGGGPQLEADVGANAVGGIYTIGSTGGTATGSTRASGTDTINLRGSVSPGEIVAVIPADKANQATMSALQTIISESEPISIGGGTVSGTDNTSKLVGDMLDGTGVAYPKSLSDPAVKDLLAQIKALLAAQYTNKSLSTPAAATAATAGGGSSGAGKDPFAESKKADAEAEKRRQEEQRSADQRGSSRGAPSASRAASRSSKSPNVIRLPKVPNSGNAENATSAMNGTDGSTSNLDSMFGPYSGDGVYGGGSQGSYDPYFSSYNQPYDSQFYDPYSAYGGGGIGYADSSYDLPYDSQFYNPYSANTDTGAYDGFTASGVYGGGGGGGYDYSFDNSSYLAGYDSYAGGASSSYDVATYDSGSVDIGANATGGIYTIGAGATSGYSGHTDALDLVGKVSPGEIVAVIPPGANSSATLSALQGITNTNITSLGGGGAQALGLTDAQVQDALAKVAALIAAQQAAATANLSKPVAASGGSGGSSGSKSPQDTNPPQDNQPAQRASRGAGAPRASRSRSKSSDPIRLPKSNPSDAGSGSKTGQVDTGYGSVANPTQSPLDSALFPAGPVGGPSDYVYGAFAANSSDLPYQSQFYDPYSAYAGGGVGYGGNSYDLPYTDQFYSPYSAGAFGDNTSTGVGYGVQQALFQSQQNSNDGQYYTNTQFLDRSSGRVNSNVQINSRVLMNDLGFAASNVPPTVPRPFFDPFSAYSNTPDRSYVQPYDSQFYDPYSTGMGGYPSALEALSAQYEPSFDSIWSTDNGQSYFDNSTYASGSFDNIWSTDSGMSYFDNSAYGGGSSDYSYDNSSYLSGYDNYGGGGYDYSGGSSYDYSGGSSYSYGATSGGGGYDYGGGGGGYDYGGGGGGGFDSGSGGGGGDAGGFATGGVITVPDAPGGGTDTVDTLLHLTGGETVAVLPKGSRQDDSATSSVADAPKFSVDRSALAQSRATDTTLRGMLSNTTSAIQMPTTRLLSGGRSFTGDTGMQTPTDLSSDTTQDTTGDPNQRTKPNDRTVNVNVFGVRDVNGFLQSRAAINRAMRMGPNG